MSEELKVGFYVGRFQPFHIGHLHVIKTELENKDKLVVLVGNDAGPKNPYTVSQRFDFIRGSLIEINPSLIDKLKLDTIDEKYSYESDWSYWFIRFIDKIKLEISYLKLLNPDKIINIYLCGSAKDKNTKDYINKILEYGQKFGINIKKSIVEPLMNSLNSTKKISGTSIRNSIDNLKNIIIKKKKSIMSFNFNKINNMVSNYVAYKILSRYIDTKKKYIIGISDMANAGKTIFASNLVETLINTHFFNKEDILLISTNNYLNKNNKINSVNLLKNNLKKIKNNDEVDLPIYNSTNFMKIYSLDKKIIIIEGLFNFSETKISKLIDLKIFIDRNIKLDNKKMEIINKNKNIANYIFESSDLIKNDNNIKNISDIIIQKLLYKTLP
jgi:cytidyltransferase-like protein